MTKNDLKKFAQEIGDQLEKNYLSAQMQYLVLNGHITFNGYFIFHDCTKNYLHLTIQSPPVEDIVMTLQISVDNKNQSYEGGDKSQEEHPSQEISMTPPALPATTTMTAVAAAMKKRAYEWACQLWNGEYKSEYSTTDKKDEDSVRNIIKDFYAILSSSSWDTEFESLDHKDLGKSEEISREHLAMQYVMYNVLLDFFKKITVFFRCCRGNRE